MIERRFVTAVVAFLCGALLAPSLASADETIRCESERSRYRYCSIRTDNRVTLVRQLSHTRCRQNDNWGYDRRGIWVDRGCAAEFRVGGRDHDHHNNRDEKVVVAGAAVAAVAIAAAVAARKEREREAERQEKEVPSWAIGTFGGYDDVEQVDVELTILPGGSVSGFAGSQEFTGNLEGSKLLAGRQHFRIERSGTGFVATDEYNARHRVTFRRTGSGY